MPKQWIAMLLTLHLPVAATLNTAVRLGWVQLAGHALESYCDTLCTCGNVSVTIIHCAQNTALHWENSAVIGNYQDSLSLTYSNFQFSSDQSRSVNSWVVSKVLFEWNDLNLNCSDLSAAFSMLKHLFQIYSVKLGNIIMTVSNDCTVDLWICSPVFWCSYVWSEFFKAAIRSSVPKLVS